jgi:hypothetical protein
MLGEADPAVAEEGPLCALAGGEWADLVTLLRRLGYGLEPDPLDGPSLRGSICLFRLPPGESVGAPLGPVA